MTGYTLFIIVLLWASLLVNLILYLSRRRLQGFKDNTTAINISLAALAIIFVFLSAEIYFYLYSDETDGIGFTLSSRRWHQKNWKPQNSLGYRDIERDWENPPEGKVLVVLGDSIAAGSGIEDIKNRFSGILQEKLGPEWTVLTIAKPGWNTADKLSGLLTQPFTPDVIILQHYVNDIEDAACSQGIISPKLVKPPSRLISPFVESSHFINYLYWRVYRFKDSHDLERRYTKYIDTCYSRPEVLGYQKELMLGIKKYADGIEARFIVVIFPDILNPEWSEEKTSEVETFLLAENAEVINLFELVAGRDADELIVNQLDAHPNQQFHSDAAGILFDVIEYNY